MRTAQTATRVPPAPMRAVLIAVAGALLAACAVGPDYVRPEMKTSPKFQQVAAGVVDEDKRSPALAPGASESALIELFILQKAAYEIAYEANNRPTWLGVPLWGLASLAEKLLAKEPTDV